jgi:hypothetical protein
LGKVDAQAACSIITPLISAALPVTMATLPLIPSMRYSCGERHGITQPKGEKDRSCGATKCAPMKHAEYLEKVIQKQIDLMHDRDIWKKPER